MRTIPAATQTVLNQDLGGEIILVLEVMWGRDTPSQFYADRAIAGTGVQGKILSMTPFEEAVQISGGGQSQQINVTLDDTDGAIKQIFNTQDVHKVPVRVWFYASGTSFAADKFSIFLGQINSPVVWSEGDRTFSFAIVNRIEDVEVGFSAEEGEFPQLPEELIGKTWPLCFGTTINVPALRAVPAVSGTLARGVGIKDFTLTTRLALANAITCPQTPIGYRCNTSFVGGGTYQAECNIAYEEDVSCLQARCIEIERLQLQLAEQSSYEFSQIVVFGGQNFPQGRRITLNINGGLFTGQFTGTPTNPTNVFQIVSRRHPLNDGSGGVIDDDEYAQILSECPSASEDAQDSDFTDTAFGPVFTGMHSSRLSWEAYRNALSANFFWAPGGATVTMQDASEIIYVANIVPSTILRVAAWRTINGNRFLLTVPDEFYTIRQTDFGGYDVMEIVFQRPLSAEQQDTGGGWSDDIYITQISTVGPNPVDIMRWLIETYTDYTIDNTSFNDVKTKLTVYHMHFPLLTRPNLLNILQDIATQARCAIWQKNDTFYLKYLSEDPTPVATIGEDDILADDTGNGTLRIELTKTEDLVTKLTATWRRDYALEDDYTLILRANVQKYGVQSRDVNYYTYGHLDWVRKTATFWLIRWANTWKRISFSTSLEFMKLEAFDAVTINLPDVATGSTVAIIERAQLDSANKQINFEAWVPVRAGEMTAYNFAFPAGISENALFPSIEARNANLAGSGQEPNFSTIAPPGHPLETDTTGIFQGISLGCNGAAVTSLEPGVCRQDHGDRFPSDINDTAKPVDVAADTTGNIAAGTSPVANGAGDGRWSKYQDLLNRTDKIEQDAARARETAQRGADSGGANDSITKSGDDFRDFVENLPDPSELDPDQYPCQIKVRILGFKTEEQGTRPICSPASPTFEEIVYFNSRSAAEDFCSNIQGSSNCGSDPPCTQCTSCHVSGVLGGTNCEPPEGQDPSMIAYRKTGLSAGDDRSFFME